MEKILEGLLLINNQDVYLQYGAFLTEDKQGDYSNYSALLKPPSMKDYPAIVYRERDGEELPEVLPQPRFEARDVTLYFAIVAETTQNWLERYTGFVNLLKSGWLQIRLPEIDKTYRMYYKECSSYDQLTFLEKDGLYAARFKVKLREPVPSV